jgi:DNA-binding transcriptional MerR regulator
MSDLETFTRGQIMELTGVDAKSLDYWAKLSVLQASGEGGGKGNHRRFSAPQVTLAAILLGLQKLGVGGNAFKEIAGKLNRAVAWYKDHGFVGRAPAAEMLISFRHDIDEHGYALVSSKDVPTGIKIGKPAPRGGRRLDWQEVVHYVRSYLYPDIDLDDDFVRSCAAADFDEYVENANCYYALSSEPHPAELPAPVYVYSGKDCDLKFSFWNAPADVPVHFYVDMAKLKGQLWGWPRPAP